MGQLNVVTVGPLATADPDGVSLSQTAAAAQYLVINGALAAGTFDADSICASQTPAGAGDLIINGDRATTNPIAGAGGTGAAVAATVRFPVPQRVYITCAGNNSGRTFTITGTVQSPTSFGTGVLIAETVTGANVNVVASSKLYSTIISISISGASTGAVTVGHSGTATMDKPRRLDFVSAADDSDITFTIVGTDRNNDPITEVLTGGATATVTSVLSYLTVASILTSAATSGAVTVGSSAIADSQWIRFDHLGSFSEIGIQIDGSGTVNWTVQGTLNDPNFQTNQSPTPTYQWTPASVKFVNHPDSALVASSVITGVQGGYDRPPAYAKLVLNSGTGSATGVFVQTYQD